MSKPLTLISLFSGLGGLDYGFEAAGFETRAAVELDADCCATLRKNRTWPVIEGDIHQATSAQILETAGLKLGEVDVLIGGPPCQPFSKSGYWARGDSKRLADPRSSTLHEYMRCVRDLLPKVFLLENVQGINYSGKEEGFRLLEQLTQEINQKSGTKYTLSWQVLSAADYGVPQLRTRFFLVGHREGKSFTFPAPTHGPSGTPLAENIDLLSSHLLPYATAWDAIGEMKVSKGKDTNANGKWADLLPSIPEGENYLWHTDRKGGTPLFGWRTRYWSFLLKLAKNLPSWTIQAQPGPAVGPFHWENRRLSVEEMSALQTLPKEIQIVGGRSSAQKQLGNAVPSLLGEVLAREMARQFFGVAYTEAPKLAVTLKRPIPEPETVKRVPSSFQHLKGEHQAHPGTGKGKWASLQKQGELGSVLSLDATRARESRADYEMTDNYKAAMMVAEEMASSAMGMMGASFQPTTPKKSPRRLSLRSGS